MVQKSPAHSLRVGKLPPLGNRVKHTCWANCRIYHKSTKNHYDFGRKKKCFKSERSEWIPKKYPGIVGIFLQARPEKSKKKKWFAPAQKFPKTLGEGAKLASKRSGPWSTGCMTGPHIWLLSLAPSKISKLKIMQGMKNHENIASSKFHPGEMGSNIGSFLQNRKP